MPIPRAPQAADIWTKRKKCLPCADFAFNADPQKGRRKTKDMYKPLLRRMIPVLALLAGFVSCSREPVGPSVAGEEGGIRIALDRDERTVVVKGDDDEESSVPPADSFWVEVYNSSAVRLYRDLYANAKDQVLKLNAGEIGRAHV